MNIFTSFLHTCSSSYLRLISLTSFCTAFLPTSPKDRLNRSLPVLQLQVFFLYWLISINIYTYSGASQVVLVVKNLPASAGDIRDTGLIPGLGRKVPWRKAWQPTAVFLPGGTHGQRSLADYSPWGRKELDTTEVT